MKRILIIAICLLGLGIPQATVTSATSPTSVSASEDGWECLGLIEGHYCYGGTEEYCNLSKIKYYLYVKAIGNKVFYQARENGNSYSISSGFWQMMCVGHQCVHTFNGKINTNGAPVYVMLP